METNVVPRTLRLFGAVGTLSFLWVLGIIGVPTAAYADPVRDISYDRWQVEYDISVDNVGRAVADVRETLTTTFPEDDVNKGIVRIFPSEYQGAATDPRDFRVTDELGTEIPFVVESDDDNVGIIIGNEYAHGEKTYVIDFRMSDIILATDSGDADEFSWDVMGFEQRTPTTEFIADVRFSPELAQQLSGKARCYYGKAGSTAECPLTRDGASFHTELTNLAPGEGVSVAIGLAPDSVVQPPIRVASFEFTVLPLILAGGAALFGAAGLTVRSVFTRRRARARGVIVPNFDVPEDLPPLIAAPIARTNKSPIAAEFVHLAVQGAIRIEEAEEPQGLLRLKRTVTRLRVVDPDRAVDPLSRSLLTEVFVSPVVGAEFTLPRESSSFAAEMSSQAAKGARAARDRGYFTRASSPAVRATGFIGLIVAAAVMGFAIYGISVHGGGQSILALIFGASALVAGIVTVLPARVHTALGAETREYLEGVKEFIRVAEADRIRVLQSASGAERRADGEINYVHLYEKLLPYAMLFGLEKQWSKTLTVRYEAEPDLTPVWIAAGTLHGVAQLESTLSSITSSFTSSATYSSSSSGGSSGGGSAGGGGGGGFAGGH